MTAPTHAITTNGRIHGALKPLGITPEEDIARLLQRLDGERIYALSLWRLPEGIEFDRVDIAKYSSEYIQCAGSADQMVIEIRGGRSADGRQSVVGKPKVDGFNSKKVVVPWNGSQSVVFGDEVFSAREASEIFIWYYHHGDLEGAGANLRAIEV